MRPASTWFAAAGAPTTFHATPPWAMADLNRVVLSAQTLWFRHRREGTILWQGTPAKSVLPVALDAMLVSLRARDCYVSDAGKVTGWFTVLREGYPDVHLGIGPLIQQGRTTFGRLDEEPRMLADRLARYADVTGAAWRGTGGLSGCAAIRSIHEAKRTGEPLWKWKPKYDRSMTGCSFELTPGKHRRDLIHMERQMRYVHHFDIRGMYLAAAGVGMFGWSAPVPTGAREFDPGRAGYWQVRREELDASTVLVMRDALYHPGTEPLIWLTTKVMSYLWENGITPEVVDSCTSERTGRYLREWSARLTAARALLDPESAVDGGVLNAVKDTYARTIGMFNRETSRVFRPDWWDTGRDTARVNMLRKVQASGLVPCRYNVDSIWVPSELDAQEVGGRLGIPYVDGREVNQVGKFAHVATYTVDEYLATYQRLTVRA